MFVTSVLRVRDCDPPPQLCVQAPHVDHDDCEQWIGHATSLQEAVSTNAEQTTPPCATGVTMERLRE